MAKQDERTHPNHAAFPSGVGGPALRALAGAAVRSVGDLAEWTEADLAKLHGIGPKALGILRDALETSGRTFRRAKEQSEPNRDATPLAEDATRPADAAIGRRFGREGPS